MKRTNEKPLPKARKTDLVTRQIPGELLVYDLKRHKAFCLNGTAASVWKSCNGKRTVEDLAAELEKDQKSPVDEKIIWLALDQLEKSYLLQRSAAWPMGLPSISRRSIIRAGIVTAVTLPLVTMITAPVAAQAGSPITDAVCDKRTQPNCGGNPCSDKAGKTCNPSGGGSCNCS